MKKPLKIITGAALGAGAACAVAGEVLYEAFLNMDVNKRMRDKGLFYKEEEARFWAENQIYAEGIKWFKSVAPEDISIPSRIGRDAFANIIPADEKSSKWAIVIHGYTAGPASMSHYALKYHNQGFNVLLPHMLGHGPDKVRYCSMGYKDRLIILDWINYILGADPDAKILLHGVSMGSATTMLVTGESLPSNVVCAVADCGYSSCWDEYAGQLKEMFGLPPFPLLYAANAVSKLRGNFDFKKCAPKEAVMRSKTPTLFVHGEDDAFVPFSMMKPLYESCSAPDKQMLSVPGAFHANSAFVENELYWNTVDGFIGKYFE